MKTISDIITESPDATDEKILAAIEASRDYRRVPVGDVTLWLLANNLLGVLNVVRDTTDNLQLKGGLYEFLSGLTLYESIDASDPAILAKAIALTGGLAQAQIISASQYDSFLDLLKEPMTATLGDIPALRAEAASKVRRDEIETSLAPIRERWNTFNAALDIYVRDGGTLPKWGGE